MADGPVGAPQPESSSFAAFDGLIDTCRRTHAALRAVVRDEAADAAGPREVLTREALSHVESVIEGLALVARTRQFAPEELRLLVRRAGIVAPAVPGSVDALAAAEEAAHLQPQLRSVDGRTMLAAGHARVVFTVIPTLYADIAAPRSQGELLVRAEELLRVVWRVAAGDAQRNEPLRRTIAFYDAGSRLSVRGVLAA